MKGTYHSQCISFITTVFFLTNNKNSLTLNTINSLHEALTDILSQVHLFQINENEKNDILLIISFINTNLLCQHPSLYLMNIKTFYIIYITFI
jgi:hypothetical protein